MSLSLLAPFALALAALLILPIIAHIARQRPRERVPFGALLLLKRVVKRLRRRRRVRDPLLLLLRLLALAAVLLAIAGLRWSYTGDTPEFGGTGNVVLVMDRSMSMSLTDGGSTLLARARTDAAGVLDALPPGTRVGLIAFDSQALALTRGMTLDRSLVRSKLDTLQPTTGRSNLRSALLEARRLLEGEPGEVMLFSDEAGPQLVPDSMQEIRRIIDQGSAVIPRPVHADPPRNVAVTSAVYGDGIEGGVVTVRVTNFGPDAVEVPCEVLLPDGQSVPIFADLPGEGEQLERITVPREALGGVGEVRCDDPDLPIDDVRYFHLPRVGASRVLVVDGDPGDTPTRSEVYFLERALAPWGGARSGVTPEVVAAGSLIEIDPEQHQVLFLANVSDPRPLAPVISEFVRKGGSVVITAGDNLDPERYNAALGSILPAPLRKIADLSARGEPGRALQIPSLGTELFEPFARAGRAGFGDVRSRRVMLLDPYVDTQDVTTMLKYEGGIPALVERRVGKGRVLLWTSTFDYGWSTLPTKSIFMPLVQRLVTYLGGDSGGGATRHSTTVGELVSVKLPDINVQPVVIGPGGEPTPSRIEGTWLFFTPTEPGAYEVTVESAPPIAWVAANLDHVESDVRRYDSVASAEARIVPELFIRHVDLAPWLFALALAMLTLQALLAVRGRES